MLLTNFLGYKIAKQLYEGNEADKEILEIMKSLITYQQVKDKVKNQSNENQIKAFGGSFTGDFVKNV